jgi:hypothetical protein
MLLKFPSGLFRDPLFIDSSAPGDERSGPSRGYSRILEFTTSTASATLIRSWRMSSR